MILETLTLAVCTMPQALPQGDDRARTLRIVPLAALIDHPSPPLPVPLPPFISSPWDGEPSQGLLQFPRVAPGRASIDDVGAIVQMQFEDEFDADRLSLDVRPMAAILQGEAALVERASAFIGALEGALAPRIRIDVWLVDVGDTLADAAASPVVAPAAIVPQSGVTWRASVVSRAGFPAALSDWRTTGIVYGINVEVAQKASISNPMTGQVAEGVRVVVEPHLLAGSDEIVLFGQVAIAELREPIRTTPTGIPGQQSIDLPVMADHAATFSARIADGGGAIVWQAGAELGGGRRALVVRATRVGEAADPDRCAVLPIGALSRSGIDSGRLVHPDSHEHGFPLAFRDERVKPPMSGDELHYLLELALGEAYENGEAWIQQVGDVLVVGGDAESRARARAVVKELEDVLLQNAEVLIRTQLGNVTLHELVLPALLGRTHFALRGIETTGIFGFQCEIAQSAKILTPSIESRFAGLAASVTPSAASGGVHVAARIDIHGLDGVRRRALEGEHGGEISIATKRHGVFTHDATMQRGTVIEFGDGPTIAGERTRQTLRIR